MRSRPNRHHPRRQAAGACPARRAALGRIDRGARFAIASMISKGRGSGFMRDSRSLRGLPVCCNRDGCVPVILGACSDPAIARAEVVEPILRFMERAPGVDFGAPGPLVHFMEQVVLCGLLEKLVASSARSLDEVPVLVERRGYNRRMAEQATPTCILLHVRRVSVEDAYVNVLVSGAIMKRQPEPDGTSRIDPDAFMREGIRFAADARVEWRREGEPTVEPHPLQRPLPDGRVAFGIPIDRERAELEPVPAIAARRRASARVASQPGWPIARTRYSRLSPRAFAPATMTAGSPPTSSAARSASRWHAAR